MREACILARQMLDLCCAMAQPGVTTDAIDAAVHLAIVEAGACPSPLNYHGFPKVLRTSIVLHSIFVTVVRPPASCSVVCAIYTVPGST